MRGRTVFSLFALLLLSCTAGAGKDPITPGMVGNWVGDAHVIVTWSPRTNLPVRLEIKVDGTVTGKIGDAMLKQGRFKSNRGWLGRKLNLKTDYIITGGLDGPLFAAEGVKRSRVMMPLNLKEGQFVGGLATDGSKLGGKEKMLVSTLRLKKQ